MNQAKMFGKDMEVTYPTSTVLGNRILIAYSFYDVDHYPNGTIERAGIFALWFYAVHDEAAREQFFKPWEREV